MGAVAFLAVANPSPKNNLGTLIRCAAAFGMEEVIVVGASRWSTHGAHGSHKHVKYRWFKDWKSAATFLRTEKDCDLCGIVLQPTPSRSEIPPNTKMPKTEAAVPASAINTATSTVPLDSGGESASSCSEEEAAEAPNQERSGVSDDVDRFEEGFRGGSDEATEERSGAQERGKRGGGELGYASTAVRHRPFRKSTAFLVGHRNRLDDKALDVCDFLVHVEQTQEYPMELGPPVTTSIALHHFTAWANYEERQFSGEKFNVEREVARCRPPVSKENTLAKERARLREELRAADPLETGGEGRGEDENCGVEFGWLTGTEETDTNHHDY